MSKRLLIGNLPKTKPSFCILPAIRLAFFVDIIQLSARTDTPSKRPRIAGMPFIPFLSVECLKALGKRSFTPGPPSGDPRGGGYPWKGKEIAPTAISRVLGGPTKARSAQSQRFIPRRRQAWVVYIPQHIIVLSDFLPGFRVLRLLLTGKRRKGKEMPSDTAFHVFLSSLTEPVADTKLSRL